MPGVSIALAVVLSTVESLTLAASGVTAGLAATVSAAGAVSADVVASAAGVAWANTAAGASKEANAKLSPFKRMRNPGKGANRKRQRYRTAAGGGSACKRKIVLQAIRCAQLAQAFGAADHGDAVDARGQFGQQGESGAVDPVHRRQVQPTHAG